MHPTQMGPYSLGPRLGRGGMGAVYEAVDTFGGETVAVKLLATHLADDAGLRRRFEAEIETLKKLRHPGIVQLLAFGEQDGQPYYAMELVRGQSLDALLRQGRRFTWQETAAAAAAIARALKVAHDNGVIHRDLKPANLLLPVGAAPADIKLADFGIAKLFGGAAHTALGNVVGTAEYMAPEQAAGRPIDARADLYALGLVMYAMLTGKPPFRAANVVEVMRMQQVMRPPALAAAVPGLPPAVEELVQRLLAKNPGDRPANALAVSRLLAGLGEAVAAASPPQPPGLILADTSTGQAATHAARAHAETAAHAPDRIDLLAPTRAATGSPPDPELGTRPATDIAAATTQVERGSRTRHMTLAEMEREGAIATARAAARERARAIAWAAAILFLLGGGGYVLFRPLSSDELFGRIEAAVASAADRQDGLREAEPLIERFLAAYPQAPQAALLGGMQRELSIDRLRIRADRREKKATPPAVRIEHEYRQAMGKKAANPAACVAALRAILGLPEAAAATPLGGPADTDALIGDVSLWRGLVAWQIEQLAPLEEIERRLDRQDAAPGKP